METLVKHLDYITDIPQTEDISMVRMHLLQTRGIKPSDKHLLNTYLESKYTDYLYKNLYVASIPTELRDVVYCFAQQSGGRTEWNFAWQRYLNANVGTDKSTLLTALGCTSDHGLLKRYLEKLVVPNCGIRTQDRLQALLAVAQNMHGGYDIARRFFRQHILQFHHYCQVQNGVPRALLHFSRLMYTQEDLKEVDEMVSNNEVCFGKDSLLAQEARENILSNALWFKEHYYNFLQALVSQTQRNKKDNENCL
ncbi:hypothetical protein C0J52_04709 [Blattella germanica]|nr:hypothetical protein C0J52_04709 [Blattella germanica]